MEKTKGMSDFDEESGVLEKHRKLAESIEMIYSSQSLLKSVLNLPPDLHELPGMLKIHTYTQFKGV